MDQSSSQSNDLELWSQARIEQYKVLEARIDRLEATQYGFWSTGVAALAVFTALKEREINERALIWCIGFVASLFTVLGWQCAISASRIRQKLRELHGERGRASEPVRTI